MKKTIINLTAFILIFAPLFVFASLVTCGNTADDPCGFADLIILVKDLLAYVLVIAAPLASIMFAYAGFIYMTSQGNTSKRAQANQIFTNVGIGLFFIAGAWLIVKAVIVGLGADSTSYLDL
jgi:hypothetical protein